MASRNVTICAGVSGTGKSTFVIRYLVNAPLSVRFLFDAESSERDPSQNEFADRLKLPPAGGFFQLGIALCNGWVPFDPHELFTGRLEDAFCFFCEWAWAKSSEIPGNKVIVVDEVWRHCSPQKIPVELANIVQSGRKVGLHLFVLTQEPNRLNSSIINGASEFVCFKLQSQAALDCVENYGFNRDEISRLPEFHFVARNLDSGGELRGQITP
jgi:hypothetical protein